MDGTFGGGDLISASLAIMLGGGTDAELHDKEVSLSTSQITGSQTAVFEYDPEDEDPQGTPPGPWDGYSLFTIDLSGVKQDIEDLQQQVSDAETCRQQVIAALQQYDPDYDPQSGECPASKVEDLVDDYQEDEETIEDLTEQVEECDECKAAVIAKLQEYDPNFDPQTCKDIPLEIDKIVDEESGFVPIPGTPIEDVLKIMGIGDTVEIEDNDYYFAVYAEGWYRSFNPSVYPQIDIKENSFYTATTPSNYDYGSLGWIIYVYSKVTKELVTTVQLGPFQGFDAGEYVKLISLSINYTNKAMNGVYETDDPYPHTPIQIPISADLTRYITTTSPNPTYRVKNK